LIEVRNKLRQAESGEAAQPSNSINS
jgi:hypothetical protein